MLAFACIAEFLALILGVPLWFTLRRSANVSADVQKFIVVPTAGQNISTELMSVMFLIALLVLLMHKLAWPLLARIVYPLARFQIGRNRKVMAALGVSLMTLAVPGSGALLEKIVQAFH